MRFASAGTMPGSSSSVGLSGWFRSTTSSPRSALAAVACRWISRWRDGGALVAPGTVAALLSRSLSEQPDYLYDIYLDSETLPFGYPRGVVRIDADTMLVTDSGCQVTGGLCPSAASLFWLPGDYDYDSPLSGYWTPELDQMDLIDMSDQVLRRMECGLVNPYWTQIIYPESLGATLTRRLADHEIVY